ncbi:MAG: hypothetical protein AAAB35_01605 [Phyllobacterium sp.]|uniref:hypothetical protein n=1 Tax=Phyllobacterium sp. TaxID=1871046 RepID=UPI0030F21D85
MMRSTAIFSLHFLRALIFSAILFGPVLAFAASYESRSPSNGGPCPSRRFAARLTLAAGMGMSSSRRLLAVIIGLSGPVP